ncbi:AraC family transcriptional regulator [Xanthomonas hortorum]|uniref:AraC family transcriptional regulator n=1 Tax=Xanthomonas hortorum TaxID=56454 RepID=UPI00159432CB|nr:AraC family transcriptional regulator [Xanthomonas hortorum]NHF65616.1 AraC family transcriptional regulator [Xanthomonas hortorum]
MLRDKDRTTLAATIARFAPSDGNYETAVPGLKLFRYAQPTVPMPYVYEPGIAVVAQGSKCVVLADEIYEYGVGQSLLTSVDLPVVSRVSEATSAEPYLGMALALDTRSIVQLATEADLPRQRTVPGRGLLIGDLSAHLQDALLRLLLLIDEPEHIPLLAPLIQREISVRLLTGPQGAQLRQLVAAGSQVQQIAKAIAWLKEHYTTSFPVEELAARTHMSPSTFRLHFRTVTGMGPLQYQKQLRLQEARWLMLNEDADSVSAAIRVGYESATQFSREYSRAFGAPPLRDINRLRQTVPLQRVLK